METTRDLGERALAVLEQEPDVDPTHIGVFVRNGVITLRGIVTTMPQKWSAERAVRRLAGVRAVVNDFDIGAPRDAARRDAMIAAGAANALDWDGAVPDNAVEAIVRDGWVTLTGTVAHPHEKWAAQRAVQRLRGVTGVANAIVVEQGVGNEDVTARIGRQHVGLDARTPMPV
jgi:osmotically-inducible protein OsmY